MSVFRKLFRKKKKVESKSKTEQSSAPSSCSCSSSGRYDDGRYRRNNDGDIDSITSAIFVSSLFDSGYSSSDSSLDCDCGCSDSSSSSDCGCD